MTSNKLEKLDFSPGIRADKVNGNFDLVEKWIKRERRRVGGFGIVEGFRVTTDKNVFTVHVDSGIVINDEGDELIIPESSFYAGAPATISLEDSFLCPETGIIELPKRPYSPSKHGYIEYLPPDSGIYPSDTELYVIDTGSGLRVPILRVDGKKIYVNDEDWAGNVLKVSYVTADDRIDSILLSPEGEYTYKKGIVATSPSHVNLGDYESFFAIAVIYWQIGTEITAHVYINHRSYRPVYVDEGNKLYLEGEPYSKKKVIYFEEPDEPEENDIYYEASTNRLLIWKQREGKYGWQVVNDSSAIPIRESMTWTTEEFPEDAQTFLFGEDREDMRFIPGKNELSIVIDNAVLMSDQFEEIIEEIEGSGGFSAGIGFKLKDPLDRPTYVEAHVLHSVRSAPLVETFQRASIFVSENYVVYSATNTSKIFETDPYYTVWEDQIEVFLDGRKLIRNVEFVEMVGDAERDAVETDKGTMSKYFRVLIDLEEGAAVSYRISRYVWSYEQLDKVVRTIDEEAKAASAKAASLETKINNVTNTLEDRIQGLSDRLDVLTRNVGDAETIMRVDSDVSMAQLPSSLKERIIVGKDARTFSATDTISLDGVTENDFIFVSFSSDRIDKVLSEGTDYELAGISTGMRVDLDPSYMVTGAKVYVQVLKIGIRT